MIFYSIISPWHIEVNGLLISISIEVWLSLVERLVWDQDVAGSNPVASTSIGVVLWGMTSFQGNYIIVNISLFKIK